MTYNELKEFKFEDWDGKPFNAVVTANTSNNVDAISLAQLKGNAEPDLVVGYARDKWIINNQGCEVMRWPHVYRIEDNKDALKPRRMTNRELSKWLAKGYGERTNGVEGYCYPSYCYDERHSNSPVDNSIKVRTWDSDKWVEPTIDLIKTDNKE